MIDSERSKFLVGALEVEQKSTERHKDGPAEFD